MFTFLSLLIHVLLNNTSTKCVGTNKYDITQLKAAILEFVLLWNLTGVTDASKEV